MLGAAPQHVSTALPSQSKRLSDRPRARRSLLPGSSKPLVKSTHDGELLWERRGGKAAPGAQRGGTGGIAPSVSPISAGVQQRLLSWWYPGTPGRCSQPLCRQKDRGVPSDVSPVPLFRGISGCFAHHRCAATTSPVQR